MRYYIYETSHGVHFGPLLAAKDALLIFLIFMVFSRSSYVQLKLEYTHITYNTYFKGFMKMIKDSRLSSLRSL
jgi:hypothetical protein